MFIDAEPDEGRDLRDLSLHWLLSGYSLRITHQVLIPATMSALHVPFVTLLRVDF